MDLFSELIEETQSDLTVGSESTLFPLAKIKSAINRSYRKIGGVYRWPETEDAKKTSTFANQEYYDYPDTWRPDTIWKLTVDDEDYGDPLSFSDYLYEKEGEVPSGKDLFWTNQWRRFFIYPTPTTNGDYNISVWGQTVVEKLVNDEDITIFSYSMPECNEAVVLEAGAILRMKGEEPKTGVLLSSQAKEIIDAAWKKVKQEGAKYIKTKPFLNVPDYFSETVNNTDKIGNF